MEQFRNRTNQPPDPRQDFLETDSFVFVAAQLMQFDPTTGTGQLSWVRHRRKPRVAFNHMTMPLEAVDAWEFPPSYPEPKLLPFELSFVDARTVRLRLRTRPGGFAPDQDSLMLAGTPPRSSAWELDTQADAWTWKSSAGTVTLRHNPWQFEVCDARGKRLLATHTLRDGKCMISGRPVPFSFVRRASDLQQSVAAGFSLAPAEKIYGCGESFSAFDKRGHSVFVTTQDAHGSQTDEMYKPVPFYLSSRGYGVFVHGSTPMTFDFGASYGDTQVLFNGDDQLDLFVFLGDPRDVLTSYTALTGRSSLPPLWSFGLWMSRITYESEEQTRQIASKLRELRIPCDVIHLDTGWFETDWCCNYEFAPSRFADPKRMISELGEQGFHLSLWQLSYFAPNNPLFAEIMEQGLYVRGPGGELLSDDAVLDFSNPRAVDWYQGKLQHLLEMGVGAIKVDFGEAAPFNGLYHSGRSGWYEHNLYPLRYNRAAFEVSEQAHGQGIIWARNAWAGSQRYPLHWGGDAEASDGGMLGSLRAGLSFGLSGFSFWSHDVGGFFPATPRDLYARWLPFGMLCSHSRCHGLPPTEPWEFDAPFVDLFRRMVELRYQLMPYIWAQAASCSQQGHPFLRPLFFEFPEDQGSWLIDDQYLFGSQIMVAPLFEEAQSRSVYLPPGEWIDLQTEAVHRGPGYKHLASSALPAILLARGGSVIPTAQPAQHTRDIDWRRLTLWVVGTGERAEGLYCAPDATATEPLEVSVAGGVAALQGDPSQGRVDFALRTLGRWEPVLEKRERYAQLLQQVRAVTQDEPNLMANLANLVALIKEALPLASWVGFYLSEGADLVLGPFQGSVACTRIGQGRGVCGTAALRRETLVVDDVTTFPDHIACDASARSEIVVPVLRQGVVLAVLDVDSHEYRAFDPIDRECLERTAALVAQLAWPS